MKTCFVIMGYKIKKDYIHNRDIDLDKTFKHIIKPVFTELGYDCKRSSDYPPGVIDTIMYKGIYNADFVLADISTLNPNALYELGVRHALKPYTTLVICEDGIMIDNKLPFDLNHITALPYRHDGLTLDIDEVERFTGVLKEKVLEMEKANQTDSPVFTFLSGLKVVVNNNDLKFADNTGPTLLAEPEAEYGGGGGGDGAAAPMFTDEEAATPSVSDMIDTAVATIKSKKFDEAIVLFNELLKIKPGDAFFIQQLCLATYKAGKPTPAEANKAAFKILEQLNPQTSTDTETLGMAGAINKNLHQLTGDKTCLEKSLRFYERGYYIGNDYYTGINAAFLYWKMASLADNKNETLFYKMQAQQIEKHVAEICTNIMAQESYTKRSDKEWISNTLAEAYFGLDNTTQFNKIIADRKKAQTDFSEDSFIKQFNELKVAKEKAEAILK